MKSLTLLAHKVLEDLGDRVGIDTQRDQITVTSRLSDEGESFLMISLANFCKDFERSLDQEFVSHDLFLGFSRKGRLPRFLGGFFDLIFDRSSGVLLTEPSIDAIYSIRQFTGMWSKIKADCTPERDQKAFDEYFVSEQAVRSADANRTEADYLQFSRISHLLFGDIFQKLNFVLSGMTPELIPVPKHGPGSTADGTLGNKKYYWRTWTKRLEFLFPAGENLLPSFSYPQDEIDWLDPGAEPPVKVITVPKNAKTPRIIAKEPVHMQYVQQALLEIIVELTHGDDTLREFIRFDDQEPNQFLAMEGSLSRDLATLDLSAASDLVSNQLVLAMTSRWDFLSEALQAARSRSADVNGKTIRLAKYASMGSALCFPIEAFVFLTLIFVGIERGLERRLTKKDIRSFFGSVRVFGDDMIVPVDHVHEAVRTLEGFGLSVNAKKSFWSGSFRESCGKEYYRGYDVSIVKLRSFIPSRPTHVEEIVSFSAFRNLAQSHSLLNTVEWADRMIGRLIPYPFVLPTSSVIGRVHIDGATFASHKWSNRYHHPLVKGVKIHAPLPEDNLDGEAALLKFFLKRGNLPSQQGHLERAGRPSTVKLKAGWYRPY